MVGESKRSIAVLVNCVVCGTGLSTWYISTWLILQTVFLWFVLRSDLDMQELVSRLWDTSLPRQVLDACLSDLLSRFSLPLRSSSGNAPRSHSRSSASIVSRRRRSLRVSLDTTWRERGSRLERISLRLSLLCLERRKRCLVLPLLTPVDANKKDEYEPWALCSSVWSWIDEGWATILPKSLLMDLIACFAVSFFRLCSL